MGTNLVNVVVHKKKEVTVRELGGSMGPIWHNYYKDVDAILARVFVIFSHFLTYLSLDSLDYLGMVKRFAFYKSRQLIIIGNSSNVPGTLLVWLPFCILQF